MRRAATHRQTTTQTTTRQQPTTTNFCDSGAPSSRSSPRTLSTSRASRTPVRIASDAPGPQSVERVWLDLAHRPVHARAGDYVPQLVAKVGTSSLTRHYARRASLIAMAAQIVDGPDYALRKALAGFFIGNPGVSPHPRRAAARMTIPSAQCSAATPGRSTPTTSRSTSSTSTGSFPLPSA